MSGLNGRPTAAELVAAVAEFLEGDVRSATTGSVNFHALVAANVLRTVQRELLDEDGDRPQAALTRLGLPDEGHLAAAIRPATSTAAVTRCWRACARWYGTAWPSPIPDTTKQRLERHEPDQNPDRRRRRPTVRRDRTRRPRRPDRHVVR